MLSQLPSSSASLSYSEVKDSQLSPSEFLDRAILLLAARHGADPNYDLTSSEEEDQQQQQQSARWLEVSKDMQALAKSHSCRSGQLRVVTTMVDDAEAFSVQACINRAKFAMYRLEKEEEERKEERRQQKQQQKQQKQQSNTTMTKMMQNQYVDPRDPKPSGFDITKGHSIADAVNRIMEECRDKIMNISISSSKKNNNNRLLKNNNNGDGCDDDSDSDDDDDPSKPIEIYKPPEHIARSLMMSEADTRRAMELGQAEEDLINRVHNLQMDHFKKYKKWVNLGGDSEEEMVPASLLSDMSPETKAVLLQQQHQGGQQSSSSSSSSLSKPIINKMSADDVAEMLGKLNLGEHIGRFRRTSGPVLAQMTKDDIRLRFDNDHEATDILWMHLEENMTRSMSGVMKNRFSNSSYYGDDVENNNNEENYAPRQQQRNSSKSAQQQRSSAAPSLGMSKESSQMKAIYDAISAPSDDLQISQRALDEFEVGNGNDSSSTSSNLREQLRQGNFGALKRTLDILEGNGGGNTDEDGSSSRNNTDMKMNSSSSLGGSGRPLRPSQEYKIMRDMQQHNSNSNNDGDLNELTDNYMNTLKSKSTAGAEVTSGGAHQNKNYGGRGGGGGGGRGGRGGSAAVPSSGSSQQKPAASTTTAAPARSGRWAIVEYDEDEDDVE